MITVDSLTKRYGAYTAVDAVSFRCEPGTVTGFLGPNGAGKTTTLRMICGLTPPTSGSSTIAGHPYGHLPDPGREIGVLLDASAQHAGRTGREVLALAALLMGLPERRVDEMVEVVGLTPAEANRRLRNYSLGMRQRLGLAHALIGDPQILILDEPANGLDPAGIHWMRGLLREFADRGGTVLLSSHLLREIEVVADDLVVIGSGKIVLNGPKSLLQSAAGTYVRALDDVALLEALTRAGLAAEPVRSGGVRTPAAPEEVGRIAAGAGAVLVELRAADGAGLEEMFLALTASDAREEVPA
jgi:ABC-2 type transport system ATP-binding protein